MEIIKETITKSAISETNHARYSIDFSITDGNLTRVMASIYIKDKDNHENDICIGYISFENELINCSISNSVKPAIFFQDFDVFMKQIKEKSIIPIEEN